MAVLYCYEITSSLMIFKNQEPREMVRKCFGSNISVQISLFRVFEVGSDAKSGTKSGEGGKGKGLGRGGPSLFSPLVTLRAHTLFFASLPTI